LSTVIYQYQNNAANAAKEMVQEFLQSLDIKKDAEDLFYFGVACEPDTYLENELCPAALNEKSITQFIENIIKGEEKKPDWMQHIEDEEDDNGLSHTVLLTILPKQDKYANVAKKIIDFLNSSRQESAYNG
jgi:hypothetical protein